MKTAFVVSFLATLVFQVVAVFLCPGEVAIHFGLTGEADGWAPSHVNALLMSGVSVLIFVSFYFVPHIMRWTPDRWMNIPNRQYWLREENRDTMTTIMTGHLYQYGVLTFLFLFALGLLSLDANLSAPVRIRLDLVWWLLGLYLGATVYWLIRMQLAFRIPKESRGRP